jgi:hypothetical protein
VFEQIGTQTSDEAAISLFRVDDRWGRFLRKLWYLRTTLHGITSQKLIFAERLVSDNALDLYSGVLDSNLGWHTGFSDRLFVVFLSPLRQMSGEYLD